MSFLQNEIDIILASGLLIRNLVEQVMGMQEMKQSKRETIFREKSGSGQQSSSTSGHPWPLR